MDLHDITPYITFFGPPAGLIAVCDYILKDTQKDKLWTALVRAAKLGERPFSWPFYASMVVVSGGLTLVIFIVGGFSSTATGVGGTLMALKSAGPILASIFLKVFILDYIFAIKTYALIQTLLAGPPTRPGESKFSTSTIIGSVLLALGDFVLTGVITAVVFHWAENFQETQVLPKIEQTNLLKALRDFFDTINVLAKASMQFSFYALNGSLVMYGALLVSLAADGVLGIFDAENMRRNVCKLLATVFVFSVFVVVIARQLAE